MRSCAAAIAEVIQDADVLWLVDVILASGAGVLADEYDMVYFPGDDLLASLRPRGLPIGNLTSQFWSNVYMNALDWYVIRELGCPAYLRYVDDFALFADSKRQLWAWKEAVIDVPGRPAADGARGGSAGAAVGVRHPLAGLCRLPDPPSAQAAQRGQLYAEARPEL